MAYTYDDLKGEFRLFSEGDTWDEVMHWWFAVAGEIYEHRDFCVPHEWHYRPGLWAIPDPEDYAADATRQADDESLQRFGALLNRYASLLKAAGKSY